MSEHLEKKVVAAAIRSREAYARITAASSPDQYTPYAVQILKLCEQFYARDKDAKKADLDVLGEWIKQKVTPKNQEIYLTYLQGCGAIDVSALNIAELVVETKRQAIRQRLAAACLAPDGHMQVVELIDQLKALETVEEDDKEEVYVDVSIENRLARARDNTGRMRLLPKALDDAVKGRCKPGHHIVVFARPETGKTALTLTMAYGFCLQKLSVIVFGNEEPVADTIDRAQCCFTGMSEEEMMTDPAKAQKLLKERGWEHLRFIPLSPGSPKQIERYVERYKPDVIIVDQIRNLMVGQETRVNQLEMAATAMRNIGKRHSVLVISVTQAGDSADQKKVLGMGDIDFSNTGIPAQADLMLGMGVDDQLERDNARMLATPKNKIGGSHVHFLVRINPTISRIEDIA
jgi:archaellum biogenesis ATPase FlaH